jgi:hypothetical protein
MNWKNKKTRLTGRKKKWLNFNLTYDTKFCGQVIGHYVK